MVVLVTLFLTSLVFARCYGIPEFGEGEVEVRADLSKSLKIMKSKLPEAVMLTSCAYADVTDRVYCFGGWNGGHAEERITEFNYGRDKLEELSEGLPTPRYQSSCVYADKFKKIYCFGGVDEGYISEIVEFNPETKSVNVVGAMDVGLAGPACTYSQNDDHIYCVGGAQTYGGFVFNPADNIVESFEVSLPGDTTSCTFSEIDKKIYCFGAWDRFQNIYVFDEETRTESNVGQLAQGRGLFSCQYVKDKNIYCIGGLGLKMFGEQQGITDEILKYNPITKELVEQDAKLLTNLYGMSCDYIEKEDKVYCLGGFNGATATANIFEYSPSKDKESFVVTEEFFDIEEGIPSPEIPIKERLDPISPPAFTQEEVEVEEEKVEARGSSGIGITAGQIKLTVGAIVIYSI